MHNLALLKRRSRALSLTFATLLLLSACSHSGFHISGPAIPPIDPGEYSDSDYQADLANYKAATAPATANLDLAKQARNNVAYGLMTLIDVVYGAYYNKLFTTKNADAVTFDTLTLGLSTASSIATHAATKTILSALGTGFSGVSLSIDKNFFAQQTFPVIGVAMQTRRDKIRATIISNMSLDTTAYPLQAAKRDLVAYLNAGTLASGLQELQEEAGAATAKGTTPVPSPGVPAPTQLAAVPGDQQVSLLWTPSAGASSYSLYYGVSPGVTPASGTKVSGLTSNSFNHTKLADGSTLTNGTTYYYVVTAVAPSGESGASNQASATPVAPGAAPVGAPSAPSQLSAAAGIGQVSLLWTQSAGATSYNVYYGINKGVTPANGTKISGIAINSYSHRLLGDGSPLKSGTTYYYVVTAVNSNGQESSSSSNEVSGTPLAPIKSNLTQELILTPH